MVIALGDTFRTTPADVRDLAGEVERLWIVLHVLRNIKNPDDRREGVIEALRGARLTPEDLVDRLTTIPIGAS
jgi:hypothetical protein